MLFSVLFFFNCLSVILILFCGCSGLCWNCTYRKFMGNSEFVCEPFRESVETWQHRLQHETIICFNLVDLICGPESTILRRMRGDD